MPPLDAMLILAWVDLWKTPLKTARAFSGFAGDGDVVKCVSEVVRRASLLVTWAVEEAFKMAVL